MFLEITNLKKSFGNSHNKTEVLKGISFAVKKGEICVLLGPSGSGKSTLLNIIGGIDSADSGSVLISGEKTADMSEKALTRYRRRHLGYVFQMYNLIPNLTVKENIEVGAYLSSRPLDIDDLLHTLGLYEHRQKLPNQLSGGQQQRTANRTGHRKKSGYPALRRAYRRFGLQHVKGNSPAYRTCKSKVWQYSYHGHAQRCHPEYGRPRY